MRCFTMSQNKKNLYPQEFFGEMLSFLLGVRPELFGTAETQRLTDSDFHAEAQFPASRFAGVPFSVPLDVAKRASAQRKSVEALPRGRKTRQTPKFRRRIR